jgi:hypothetical protein
MAPARTLFHAVSPLPPCNHTSNRNLTASTNHLQPPPTASGWGMYALQPIEAEEFVIEYIGEAIRAPLADKRERQYMAAGMDDYMFRVDDE